jgi:hypothetical protein
MGDLIALLIKEIPDAIALGKELFAKANPDAPVPTDEEVAAAYIAAYQSSIDKDNQWLAAHPS